MSEFVNKDEFENFKNEMRCLLETKISKQSWSGINRENLIDEQIVQQQYDINSIRGRVSALVYDYTPHTQFQELIEKMDYLMQFLKYKDIVIDEQEFNDFIDSRKLVDVLTSKEKVEPTATVIGDKFEITNIRQQNYLTQVLRELK
jgi:hypothetical protein